MQGVLKAYAKFLWTSPPTGPQLAVRQLATTAVKSILTDLKKAGLMVDKFARFQFFGVLDSQGYVLVGRVNRVVTPTSLAPPEARMYMLDPATVKAFPLSGVDNIPKNNTFTTLITLPASDFYNL